MGTHNSNHLCPYCLISTKCNIRCGQCGKETITVSSRARIPKKGSKKKKWAQLFQAFPYILKICPYTKALNRMGFK